VVRERVFNGNLIQQSPFSSVVHFGLSIFAFEPPDFSQVKAMKYCLVNDPAVLPIKFLFANFCLP
jgi:hypothetical protein